MYYGKPDSIYGPKTNYSKRRVPILKKITMMSEGHLLYLPSFQTIVCQTCEHGITKRGIRLHLERHHMDISLKERRELENYADDFHIAETTEVQSPLTTVEIIKGLKLHEGFICTSEGCSHLCTTLKSMKQHCWSEHGWTLSKGVCHI